MEGKSIFVEGSSLVAMHDSQDGIFYPSTFPPTEEDATQTYRDRAPFMSSVPPFQMDEERESSYLPETKFSADVKVGFVWSG